ncbi:MAG: cyclic nucleotide-binding domain-containing protein [Legionellaceae bacterium]|nr:cyclic nucleotide-binding domain-containing protein [Legionellaceae bacterium]
MDMPTNTIQLLKNSFLFVGLSDQELSDIASSITTKVFKERECIISEEDNRANEFYIIVSGQVQISKNTDDTNTESQVIKEVSTGDTLGESALLETKKRTASAISLTETKMLVIPLAMASKYTKIKINLANGLSQRLSDTNSISAKALRQKINLLNMRVETGRFLILIVTIVSIYSYCFSLINTFVHQIYSQTMVGFPMMLLLISPVIYLIKKSDYPLSFFGINAQNLRFVVVESILWTIPFVLFMLVIKWLYVSYISSTSVFLDGLLITTKSTEYLYMVIGIIVYMLMVPMQELAIRGATQGCLEKFLIGKHRVLLAVIVSNLIFGVTHLHLGIRIALSMVFVGMFWGALYARQHTLIGVTISHAIIGFVAFWIIGADFLFS